MARSDLDSLYRCPLCKAPAPSVGACKIHISRCNDEVHWGYVGDDLHDEIVARQVVTDRGVFGKLRYLIEESNFIESTRRMAASLLHR